MRKPRINSGATKRRFIYQRIKATFIERTTITYKKGNLSGKCCDLYMETFRMRKKTRRNILLVLIAFIATALIIGYRIWNAPHKNIKNADGVKCTASQLYTNLSRDSATMKSKFVNKVVIVSGQVKSILVNQQGQQIILLKTNIEGGSVNCTMEEKNNQVKQGDIISIKGICSGYIGGDPDIDLPGDVFLIRCYTSN